MLNLLARKPNNVEDVDELKRQVQVLQARLNDAHVKVRACYPGLVPSAPLLTWVEGGFHPSLGTAGRPRPAMGD